VVDGVPARLQRSFLARPSPIVAPELLGHVLARRLPNGIVLRARIVECEAYQEGDPASHSFRGPTPRNEVMFGPAGHLYVYFTYGMHWCMNVITGRLGEGSAVLLRAGEPLDGVDEMARRRGRDRVRDLCAGPAKWTQAFGVDRGCNGEDLVRGRALWLERGSPVSRALIDVTPRVGLSVAVDRPWRFVVAGSPWASRPSRARVSGAISQRAPSVPPSR
jgi:DNA-3-methyladenine glycosylase